MTMAEVKVKQWGNSLGLIIPNDIAKTEEIDKGDTIKVDILKEKRIDAFGMFKGIPSFKREKYEHEDLW